MDLKFENIKKVQSNLDYPSQLFINGKYQKSISEICFENISPIDGRIVNKVYLAQVTTLRYSQVKKFMNINQIL